MADFPLTAINSSRPKLDSKRKHWQHFGWVIALVVLVVYLLMPTKESVGSVPHPVPFVPHGARLAGRWSIHF